MTPPSRDSYPNMSDAEFDIMVCRIDVGCRTCSECIGRSHHWLEDWDEVARTCFVCKHCTARGDYCDKCDGEGETDYGTPCTVCLGEGVVQLLPERN